MSKDFLEYITSVSKKSGHTPVMGGSFWQKDSLITHILLELELGCVQIFLKRTLFNLVEAVNKVSYLCMRFLCAYLQIRSQDENTPNCQIICPISIVWDFHDKRIHWASVVRVNDRQNEAREQKLSFLATFHGKSELSSS